ncbi:MarR family transcriptional regulator [Arthrobacter sp. ov118]|uniref:MarR family transcriptional regulator n=1 Tax=Arthrobacter sp. ov118 TaxID=1761747 RepID=UPI0008E9BB3E|nr:MarR family transcriptional regulator [Arthrobacter sp. ov118]SFU05689.1 hypothetical protein SAMN04487915_10982 [Arthrobacter sp. ov118]
MYVLTIDQRGSTGDVDRVPALLAELSTLSAELPTAGHFERSVGDEIQGVVEGAGEVVEIALHALRSGRWYVGIGVGEVDLPLPASPREGSGPAFVAARAAVDRAKAAAAHVPLAVAGGVGRKVATGPARRNGGAATGSDGPDGLDRLEELDRLDGLDRVDRALACANAEAVLRLIGRLVLDRTPAQWKVVDMLRSVRHGQPGTHGTQKIAAQNLGITEQSVSRAVLRSGWQEEWAARPAAEMLLALADSLIAGTDDGGPARHPGEAKLRHPQARARTTQGDT